MAINRETIEELETIQGDMKSAQASVEETERVLRSQKEHFDGLHRKFEDKLKHVTDGANAVVLGGRAYWMSSHSLLWVNLQRPEG